MTYENEQEPTPEEMKYAKRSGRSIGVIVLLCIVFWFWVALKIFL